MTISAIEKNKLDNIDLQQIEYFSDLIMSEKDIVIIEPNNSIAITARKHLSNLGFENIYVCKEVKEGIKIFSHFIVNDTNVPIIIDNGSSKNIKNAIKEILEIHPRANIIITTTKEKTDPKILKLFDIGISSVIHKPFIFEDFKKFFSKENETVEEIKEIKKNDKVREDIKEITVEKDFESLLALHSQITHNKFKDIYKLDQLEIEKSIGEAIASRRMVLEKEIFEAACNKCNSTNITYTSGCPRCNESNFEQKNLIEHYSCGEVYTKETDYNTCPKCHKDIGAVGTDYRDLKEHYICNSCNDRFPMPLHRFICLDCNNIFNVNLSSWKKSNLYKILK